MSKLRCLIPLCFLSTAAMAIADEENPDPGALADGKMLYEAHCAICHGMDGSGGRGPKLAQANLDRAPTTSALARLVRAGIRGTEMPGNWMLSSKEIDRLVLYVESLSKVAAESIPGDPELGRQVYEAQNCSMCHIVNGEGSSLGPELTDVGMRRSAAYLEGELRRPAESVPDRFLMILAVPDEGGMVEGVRINEDSFSIQLRDADNEFHSFRKGELKSFRKQRGKTLMPSYGDKLSDEEMEDLVAFLAQLRGKE